MSDFLKQLKGETEARLSQIEQELTGHRESFDRLHQLMDALEAERAGIRKGLASVLSWEPPEEEEPPPVMAHPADPPPAATNGRQSGVRKAYVRLPDTAFRDWVCEQTGEFGPAEMAKALGVSRGTAKNKLNALAQHKPPLIRSTGAKWVYIDPKETGGPTRAPRSAPEVDRKVGVGAARSANGSPVPHTGQPDGASGKPGRDRKRQRAGRNIKHKPVKGVRI